VKSNAWNSHSGIMTMDKIELKDLPLEQELKSLLKELPGKHAFEQSAIINAFSRRLVKAGYKPPDVDFAALDIPQYIQQLTEQAENLDYKTWGER